MRQLAIRLGDDTLFAKEDGRRAKITVAYPRPDRYQSIRLRATDVRRLRDWLTKWLEENNDR